MTPEVKQRIEQIQRGEVPEGYKKTKVGIIPTEWETVRFKDKFDRLMRRNGEGNSNVLTISAQHGLISQEDFFNKEVAGEDKSNYFLLRRGEYAYNKSYSNGYPFGAIKRLDRYDAGIVSPLYICFSAGKENACPEYYLQYFEGGKLNSEIHAFAQEGARNHGLLNISIDDFFNSAIPNPPLHEQQRIVEILSTQDKVITLLEQKAEQLRQMKKYYLSKMFPKRGENVPEIRFPGFPDAWEQRKLGDLYETLTERNTDSLPYDKTLSVATMTYKTDGNGAADSSLGNYKRLRIGDIAFEGHTSKEFRYGRFVLNDVGDGLMSPRFSALRPKCEMPISFWKYYIHYEPIMRKILVCSTKAGTMMNELVVDDFFQNSLLVPAEAEQEKIGEVLVSLDNLITLHQRKCDEEKQKKKALMQLLLTGMVRIQE